MRTARSTSGEASDGCGTEARSTAVPPRKAASTAASPVARNTAPQTSAFAASTMPRRGIAANVTAAMPESNSPVIASAPSTPVISWPSTTPASMLLVGSPPGLRVLYAASTPQAAVAIMPRSSVAPMAGRLRALRASIATACRNVYLVMRGSLLSG